MRAGGVASCFAFFMLVSNPASGFWSVDPAVGLRVDDGPSVAMFLKGAADGTGGVILSWSNWSTRQVEQTTTLQRVSGDGELLWIGADASSPDYNYMSSMNARSFVVDGQGNSYVAHVDGPDANRSVVLVQKFDREGNAKWPGRGVRVSTQDLELQSESDPQIVPGHDGNIIVLWNEVRPPDQTRIFAQMLNVAGVRQWAANGVLVGPAAGNVILNAVVTDGDGGVISFFSQFTPSGDLDQTARRLTKEGVLGWGGMSVLVMGGSKDQFFRSVVADGAGGAIVACENRNIYNDSLIMQRLDSNGQVMWGADGVSISTDTRRRYSPQMVADGNHAWVTWMNGSGGDEPPDLRVQKVDYATGTSLWGGTGVLVKAYGTEQAITLDGEGGVVVGWVANEFGSANNLFLYAQRLDENGNFLWDEDSLISSVASEKKYLNLIPVGNSHIVPVWVDSRHNEIGGTYGTHDNPYAAYLLPNGSLMGVTAAEGWELYE